MFLHLNNYKKILSIILICAVFCSALAGVAKAEEDSETDDTEISEYCRLAYMECAESEAGRLFVNEKSGRFFFEDNVGQRWYSNPDMADADDGASGIYRMELQSLMIIHYYDYSSKQFKKDNTETSCVRSGGSVRINKLKNGFEAVYDFSKLGFEIPIKVILNKSGVTASVECKYIKEKSPDKFMLYRISLLPYFGAGGPDEEGYILVADGSGCIMNFNNGRYTKLGYSSHIYGDDISKYLTAKPAASYPIMMPVYGIKKSESAITAIVTDGAAQGVVWCYPNKSITSYANVYTAFDLRETDKVVLNENSNSAQQSSLYQKGNISLDKISVSYLSLTGSDADYNGMARAYKEYLMKRDGLRTEKQNIGLLSLDFYGAVKKKKSVLGFPVTVNQPLSKLSDIEKYIEKLYDRGLNDLSVTLRYWSSEQLSGKIDYSLKPVSVIGTKSELNSLSESLSKNGGILNLSAVINTFKKSGKGYFKSFDSAKSLSNAPIYRYDFYISNSQKNTSLGRYAFLKPSLIKKMADTVQSNMCSYKHVAVSLGNISNSLYSDFNKKNVYNLDATKNQIINAVNSFGKTAMDTPADYVIKNTSLAQHLPAVSSQSDIFDYDIPFIQLILSGIVPYTCETINLSPDAKAAVLEAAATGSSLQFDLITEDAYSVVGTSFDELYASEAELLYEQISQYSKYFTEMNEILSNSIMLRYYRNGNVSETRYSDNKAVFVDRDTATVKIEVNDDVAFEFSL